VRNRPAPQHTYCGDTAHSPIRTIPPAAKNTARRRDNNNYVRPTRAHDAPVGFLAHICEMTLKAAFRT
jgi:hypothetical protein